MRYFLLISFCCAAVVLSLQAGFAGHPDDIMGVLGARLRPLKPEWEAEFPKPFRGQDMEVRDTVVLKSSVVKLPILFNVKQKSDDVSTIEGFVKSLEDRMIAMNGKVVESKSEKVSVSGRDITLTTVRGSVSPATDIAGAPIADKKILDMYILIASVSTDKLYLFSLNTMTAPDVRLKEVLLELAASVENSPLQVPEGFEGSASPGTATTVMGWFWVVGFVFFVIFIGIVVVFSLRQKQKQSP